MTEADWRMRLAALERRIALDDRVDHHLHDWLALVAQVSGSTHAWIYQRADGMPDEPALSLPMWAAASPSGATRPGDWAVQEVVTSVAPLNFFARAVRAETWALAATEALDDGRLWGLSPALGPLSPLWGLPLQHLGRGIGVVMLVQGPSDIEVFSRAWADLSHAGSTLVAWRQQVHKHQAKDQQLRHTVSHLQMLVERALERLERQQGDNERALADASNRLQALIDSMADGCVTLNARGELRSINAAARQIFMVQDEADWRGLALTALIPGLTEGMQAPADDMTALLTALLDRGSFETEGRRLSGSACALELSLTRGVLAGEVIYTAIVRDISERKRLEAERRRAQQSAERYRRLFVHSQSMPAIASFDGYFQEINATWSQVLGFREPVLRARPFYALVHPDDRPAVQAAIAQLIRGEVERIRFSHRCRTAHGEDRWLSWNTSVDHHEQRLYAVAHDITELVLTRERLRHKEQLLQQSARIARVGGWVMSLADQRLQWSDEVFRIHELPIGPSPSLAAALRFYPDQAAAQLREAIDTAIRDGKPWDLELPFTTAQGRRLWVRAKGEPEREGGQVVRLRGTFQDISRQKEIARMKDEFVSMVSHELRTPLTSILGSLRLLETGVAGTLSERVAGLVHIATGNAQRLVRLVSDILDLDKMGAGKLELRLSQRELDDVIRKAIKSIDAVALQAQVHIRCDLAVFPTLLLDEDRITQVLVNLLSNAIKFSPPEGVVRIDVEAWPEKVRVSVRDQGPGIAAEDISKLFTPFQQLDTSDARAKGGTGLGLAISKGIVHKHGGHIGVNSEPGKGACFWFELPVRC